MKLGVQVGLGPDHTVLDRDPDPPPPKGHNAQFFNFWTISVMVKWLDGSRCRKVGLDSSNTVCCGQMAGLIKMALGMDVGLGPGHIVLDVNPAPLPKKGAELPQFSAHICSGQTAGWIKMPLGTEEGLGPGDILLDGDPAPPKNGGTAPNFWPMFIVAKRLHGSRFHLVRR